MLPFTLVSPERQLRASPVHMVVVPGAEGDFGVLAGHAPLMSTIRPGAILVFAREGEAPERIFIEGGFAEVSEAGLTILAERATPVSDLDPAAIAGDLATARAEGDDARVTALTAMQAAVAN